MFSKILIANRGEIAVRIINTCKEMGIGSVAVFSEADSNALHVREADETINLGSGPASENYLNIPKILQAAKEAGAEAIHPGYGFLAENAEFAKAVSEAGMTFIGPSADAITTMGEKIAARKTAIAAHVPLAPGSEGSVETTEEIQAFGDVHGYPLLVKAAAGGGGRGMRRINNADEVEEQFQAAFREAMAAFGNGDMYVERYLVNARHIEVQIMADTHGNVVYLGDRDCSIQRRHQKLIEEAPAPGLSDELRQEMGQSAVRLAQQVNYVNAGTVEFLVEEDQFYFLEMNTRIQVEHPITEMVQDIDLIREQIQVAAGHELSIKESGRPAQGVAIEARINAEDPSGGRFVPTPGQITELEIPEGKGLRFDSGYTAGDEIQPFYDSLIGKMIAWAETREEAIERLNRALSELYIGGIRNTAPAARHILEEQAFQQVSYNTLWLENHVEFPDDYEDLMDPGFDRQEVTVAGRHYWIPRFDEPTRAYQNHVTGQTGIDVPADSSAGRRRNRQVTRQDKGQKVAFDGNVTAPMQGTIVKVNVEKGQFIDSGDTLFVLEAMKMENPIVAPEGGVIGDIEVAVGEAIAAGSVLTKILVEVNA